MDHLLDRIDDAGLGTTRPLGELEARLSPAPVTVLPRALVPAETVTKFPCAIPTTTMEHSAPHADTDRSPAIINTKTHTPKSKATSYG